jgi:integrase
MQFALSDGSLKDDPTAGIKNMSGKTEGFRTWNEDDIAAFEARHPLGTRERLALALLLCTAQRRGDVVRMGRQHIRNGAVEVTQQKTGTKLAVPIHPDLQAALAAMPSNHLTFLTTLFGKPFAAAGFTNWFREACNAAGLPKGTSAHGLRKAAARRLAEAGCSANVIASITGHKSLNEIERYTKAADQARMARDGMATLIKQRTTSG